MDSQNREYMREYMKANKDKYTVKTKCFCGGSYDTIHRARHFRSKRHCKAVNEMVSHNDTSPQHTHK